MAMSQARAFAAFQAGSRLEPHTIERRAPGPEIVGRVAHVGERVENLRVGDIAGVGCMVHSCLECAPCHQHTEQFCVQGTAFTYNSTEMDRSTPTYGGYSTEVVVNEHFVAKVPAGLDPAGA